jgi:cobalamin synthase
VISKFYTKIPVDSDSIRAGPPAMFALCIVIVAVLFPFAIIWAVNTLFKTNIDYTIINWFAVVILYAFFGCHHAKIRHKE